MHKHLISNILIVYDGEISTEADQGVEAVQNHQMGMVHYLGNIIFDNARQYKDGTAQKLIDEANKS